MLMCLIIVVNIGDGKDAPNVFNCWKLSFLNKSKLHRLWYVAGHISHGRINKVIAIFRKCKYRSKGTNV